MSMWKSGRTDSAGAPTPSPWPSPHPAGRVAILSDTHLGRGGPKAVHAEMLRGLWQGYDHLVINGDVAEVQIPELRLSAERELDRLQTLCARDGVSLTLLSGNHDAFLSERRHLLLADDRVLVTHGDAVHPAVSPWTRSARQMRAMFEAGLASEPSPDDPLKHRLDVAKHVGHHEFVEMIEAGRSPTKWSTLLRPWAVARVIYYWYELPRLAAQLAETCVPSAQVILLGHSHRQGVWQFNGRTVINTGAYAFPGKPYRVELQGDRMVVQQIRRTPGGFAAEPAPILQHTLDDKPSS